MNKSLFAGSPRASHTGAPSRAEPKPRTHCPTVSVIRLGRSPLRRLAWIFGFGR
jgi:hypothetical protein